MPAVIEQTSHAETPLKTVASALAATRSSHGEGRGAAHLVRLNNAVLGLLEAAKPVDQPMVHFLKECAVTVALQRLEASQK